MPYTYSMATPLQLFDEYLKQIDANYAKVLQNAGNLFAPQPLDPNYSLQNMKTQGALAVLYQSANLAQGNPRFNRNVNPLYFLGLASDKDSPLRSSTSYQYPFVEQIIGTDEVRSSNSITTNWTSSNFNLWKSDLLGFAGYGTTPNGSTRYDASLGLMAPYIDVSPYFSPAYNAINNINPSYAPFSKFLVQQSDIGAADYDDVYVHVGDTGFKTYWDFFSYATKSVGRTILDSANNLTNQVIGTQGIFANDIVSNTLGIDLVARKENFINNLEGKYLGKDSEDPVYGALNGMNIGQTRGRDFKTIIPGFFNSTDSVQGKEGDAGWNLLQATKKLLTSGLGGLDNGFDDRISWYLPNTNPAIYSLDHRLMFGNKILPTPNIRALFKNASDIFIPNNPNIIAGALHLLNDGLTTALQIGSNLLSGVKNAASNALGDLTSAGINSAPTYTSRFTPDISPTVGGLTTYDRALSLILKGLNNQPEIQATVPLQRHRDFVENSPIAQNAKWFVVDKAIVLEQKGSYFISDIAVERFENVGFPNIRIKATQDILALKKGLASNSQIFEGPQQRDGSFNGVTYQNQNFDPDNGVALLTSAEVLQNVPQSAIRKILGEPQTGLRDYSNISPDIMATKEPQYFPFWIRTISRDDNALIQQPFYDNGQVFMGKRKVSGNSAIFFDATVTNIQESFQSQIGRDMYIGRTEDILNYQSTRRTFSLEFTLPVVRPSDIPIVREKTNALIQAMYPQVAALTEVGIVGFRRGPVIELHIGDQWHLYGMIESLTLMHGLDSQTWEVLPGGRVLRGVRFNLSLALTHAEMPNSVTDFYSSSFKPEVFAAG